MKKSEGQVLVAKLAAAYPRDWLGEASVAVYLDRIASLPYFRAALDAVDRLIDSEPRLPSIARIREDYGRYHDKYAPLALMPPEPSEAEQAENQRLLRLMAAHLAQGEGHADTVAACEHPGCAELAALAALAEATD